jgi:hypothetical protein
MTLGLNNPSAQSSIAFWARNEPFNSRIRLTVTTADSKLGSVAWKHWMFLQNVKTSKSRTGWPVAILNCQKRNVTFRCYECLHEEITGTSTMTVAQKAIEYEVIGDVMQWRLTKKWGA